MRWLNKKCLELRNITKTFGNVIANDDVSITVHKGTIHAIVGENGAGKSTIMRIAYGFYNADSGEIYVDGKLTRSGIRMTRSRLASAWCISILCWSIR